MRKPKALLASSEDSSRVTLGTTRDNGDRRIGAEWEVLNGGRRAGRDAAGNNRRNENDDSGNFHPVDRRRHLHNQRRSRDGTAGCRADGANVGIERCGVQINAAVQLRREKDGPEEY